MVLPALELTPIMKLLVLTSIGSKQIHAASGLVKIENNMHIIADDELSLLSFSLLEKEVGREQRLFSGELPTEHKERKRRKPDLESLTLLPKFTGTSALLAVPSGSKANRQIGVLIELTNKAPGVIKNIDFSHLYGALESEFSELNIEGASFSDSKLTLLQRGNGLLSQNAVIELDQAGVLSDLSNSQRVSEKRITKISRVDLGKHNNVSLGFTDSCYCDSFLFFLAVAEESNSTYEDGQFSGAYIGYFDHSGKAKLLNQLIIGFKPEGLWIEKSSEGYECYVVTDADDPNEASQLYSTKIKI